MAPFFLCYYAGMSEKDSSAKYQLQLIANGMASRLLLEKWKPTRADYEKVLNQIKDVIKNS